MPDPVRLNDPQWVKLINDRPGLFHRLVDCIDVIQQVDRQAGFGAYHALAMWEILGLAEEYIDPMLAECNTPYKLYVTLRACGFVYMDHYELCLALRDNVRFDFGAMCDHIKIICPTFDADLAKERIAQGK